MNKKIPSLLIICLIYIMVILSELSFYFFLPIKNILLLSFLMILLSSVIVYIFSLIFKNGNISKFLNGINCILFGIIFPLKITELNSQSYAAIGLIVIYGVGALILNILKFKSLKEEDPRYFNLRKNKFWFLINLFLIHLVPSLILYTCLLPVYNYLELSTVKHWNLSSILAFIIAAAGLFIRLVADAQIYKFKQCSKNPLEVCMFGMWGKSRHPNYFGEILYWWGIFLMMLSIDESKFILLLGPLLVTILIVVITIPLSEKLELATRRDYEDYIKITNLLFPIRKKVK